MPVATGITVVMVAYTAWSKQTVAGMQLVTAMVVGQHQMAESRPFVIQRLPVAQPNGLAGNTLSKWD